MGLMMRKTSINFQKLLDSRWAAPAGLLALCILAYGLLIPWLGYSYDEWHFVYYASMRGGQSLTQLFNYDGHPQALWFYQAAFQLLGSGPNGWHFFSLFWKAASVLMFWVLLLEVWPARRWQAFSAALLFGLYPLFTLQVFPIAYSEVWFSFCLLFLSFFLSLKAVKQPEKFWLWTSLALLVKVASLFTSEYTWFLEVLRPALIWIVLPASQARGERLRRAALTWLPYFALFLGSVLWRGFFYQPLRKSFRVSEGLFSNPLATALGFLRYMIPDAGLTLFSSWAQVIKPAYLDPGNRTNLIILALGLLSAGAVYLSARGLQTDGPEPAAPAARQALLVGALGLAAGLLPAYLAGYTVFLSEWPGNARLALAAFPGAALILTALLEIALAQRARLAVLAVIAGLLVGWQFRVENDFRQVWEARTRFYQQLTWRMPGIRQDTALVMADSYLPVLEPGSPAELATNPDFAMAMSINVLYAAQPGADGRIPYWYYGTPYLFSGAAVTSPPHSLNEEHATLHFSSDPARILALYFNPAQGECLRVLDPGYASYARIPPETRALAQLSDPQNILVDAHTDFSPFNTIIGPGEPSGWCYFYEKGELAAQRQDWKTAAGLWNQTRQAGLRAANGYENLVFIRALMQTGDWKNAFDLTRETRTINQGMASALCSLWLPTSAAGPQGDFTARAVDLLQCQK